MNVLPFNEIKAVAIGDTQRTIVFFLFHGFLFFNQQENFMWKGENTKKAGKYQPKTCKSSKVPSNSNPVCLLLIFISNESQRLHYFIAKHTFQ